MPKWLGDRMTRLGAVMCEAIIHHYGRNELLRRLAHPFWFQSFGAVMGMDWHSSGITTSVVGALKRGLTPLSGELGIHVCGGRGAHSRKTPHELAAIGERIGFDGTRLATASRLVAKVDSAAVQDGFDLYLHGFIVTDDGDWVVVQQGMNGDSKVARRYHWLSEGLKSFVDQPHAAIEGANQGEIVNLTDRRAEASRQGQLDLLQDLGPDRILREFAALHPEHRPSSGAAACCRIWSCRLTMMSAKAMSSCVVCMETWRRPPSVARRTFPSFCWFPASARAPCARWRSSPKSSTARRAVLPIPARFSLAHGGKDQAPVSLFRSSVYDETIGVLKSAVQKARLGREEEIGALKRLDDQSRQVERCVTGPSLKEIVAGEFDQSHLLGGRSVFGWEPAPDKAPMELNKEGITGRRSHRRLARGL